jgi:hypothetical protein
MKFVEAPVFSWTGDTVTPPPKDRKSADLPHYNAFKLGELSVDLGDFILVKPDDGSENLQDCEVARLDRLYQDTSATSDPYRAEVTWLCRPSLLPKKLEGHGFEEDGIPKLDERLDVVTEARPFAKNISAETIYFKCNVFSQPMSTVPEDFIKSCPKDSKYPSYVLRFKMKATIQKKIFTLEPYQSREGPSPLKLSTQSRSPLKERSRNRADSLSTMSPVKPLSPKLVVSIEYMEYMQKSQNENDLGKKRRRRLSSRGSNSGDTPVKRVKKSTSVQNTPEKPSTPSSSPRPARSAGKPARFLSTSSQVKDTCNTGRKSRQSDSVENTPKSESTRSSRRSILPPASEPQSKEPAKRKRTLETAKDTKKTPVRRSVVSTEEFTEVKAETNSGRKLKITCGEKTMKVAPSKGLDNNAIGNLLELDSDQDFEPDPKEEKRRAASNTPIRASKRPQKAAAKAGSKSTSKAVSKAKVEPQEKKPSPKKRTRRASMSVVEQAPSTPATNNRRKSVAKSETKMKKKIETYSSSSNSDSDFQGSSEGEEEDSDFEREPNVVRYKSKKAEQKSKTLTKSILDRKGFTPGVQQRAKPVPANSNPMVEAQTRLHVSAVPEELPCREEEFAG